MPRHASVNWCNHNVIFSNIANDVSIATCKVIAFNLLCLNLSTSYLFLFIIDISIFIALQTCVPFKGNSIRNCLKYQQRETAIAVNKSTMSNTEKIKQ
jgi:hypothetical protein